MHSRSIALILSLLAASAQATTYSLVDTFDSTNFFSTFDFFSSSDPTNGFVTYTTASEASGSGLAGYVNDMVYLGVDHTTVDPTSGRESTRVTSQSSYTKGLFVADIVHMPVGCGVWPALWTLGPNWPSGGEIDIIEGVNSQTTDEITLHTASGCTMSNTGSSSATKFTTGTETVDCGSDDGYDGCAQSTTDTNNYGTGFNDNGGGVYAMEWTSDFISVWFFSRSSSIASTLTSGSASPDSSTFGTPTARFSGCDIDSFFSDHQIVINTDLCGDWAGNVWSEDATCSAKASTCTTYVQQNPEAFTEAYWLINSIKVYQQSSSSKREAALQTPVKPVPFMA
ncbi:beta-glucanase [Grosmannia clavigera kw1407]|uniref:endo-1,3(4)-beta-glucanase n=1 Tax=Grosmannia clavigera (strain kw1407 / UAMH 11150) TaxID=655863 RepID=F0XII6_GROCL|nr:beta-glucanase [Grosmannia clavigera kw1407]EFX02491.1 beta-glucanase [Grosmannia clavigera kw1407]